MLPPLTITNNEYNQRYDKFLRKYFKKHPHVTLKDIFAWMRKWYIKINSRKHKENYRLQIGDVISFDRIPESEHDKLITKNSSTTTSTTLIKQTEKRVIYQDTHWLALNKPAWLVIHGGTKQNDNISLHDHLQQYAHAKQIADFSETFSPSYCYRLDKDTSGVIIAALTYPALQLLNQLIRDRQVQKKYHTVVVGKPRDHGTINQPLFKWFDKKAGRSKSFVNKEKGQHAITHYQMITSIDSPLGTISLLEVGIETGRIHQIRVHLASIGHPVVGDIMYGDPAANRIAYKKLHISRQLLHASEYSFFDSIANQHIRIDAPLPDDIRKIIGKL